MTQRYYARWKVQGQGGPSYIKIYDFENTAFGWGFSASDPQKLTINSDGVKISYSGREDNIFEPIKVSSLELNLVIENDEQAAIITAARDTKEFNLGIEFGYTVGTVDVPKWYGVLAPQSVQVDYGIHPYGASLTFTDGLKVLEEVSYRQPNGDPYEDHVPLLLHLQRCLQYLPTLPLFSSQQVLLGYVTNIYHDNHDQDATVGPDMDVLYRTACSSKTFYTENPRENYFNNLFLVKRKTLSCYDVIEEIMTVMQLTLTMREGYYMAYSHLPYLVDPTFITKYRYQLSKNNVVNLVFAPGNKISSNDVQWVIEENSYDVLTGSKEGILPPSAGVSYVHRNGGSNSVFPRAQTHYIDVEFSDLTNFFPRPHGNLGDFQPNQGGALIGGFPKQDDEVEVPTGTGFRMRGRFRMRVRNPRNDFLNDPGDPVTRADEMIGAKIIVSMKIRVGNYYLRQSVTQLGNDDFTDENDWGEIIINAGAPGASAAAPSYYYPIEHGDAEWTQNSTDRFEFMVLHPDFTQPAVETLEYDDEDGIVTEYPVGLWLKRQTNTVNKARYSTASYQEWLGESGNTNFIEWLDNAFGTGNNSQYYNPVIESDIDLQLPALPDSAGDQVGIEIDCSIRGYTAEGYILYDSTVANLPNPSTNYSWLGNVLVGVPAWMDFEFFVGDASRSYDPMYSAEDDNPQGTEDLLLGTTILGSRYDERLGSLGYLTTALFDENGDYLGYGTFASGWNSISLPQAANKGILQVCANIAMDYYGAAKRQFQLLLIPKQGNTTQVTAEGWQGTMITPGSLFYFEREGLTLLVQSVSNNLHRGTIDMLAVELDHDPRVITEYDNTPIRGITGGGMAPAPGGVQFSHRSFVESRKLGRSLKPEQVDKLSFINLNATNTGVDTITGFSGAGLTQEQIDKLAAIILDANGGIQDFTVAVGRTPLTSDEVNDTNSTHKFATQAELNAIAGNTASLNDIYAVFKETTTGDGAGVYVNTASTTESHVSVTSTSGKLQAGENTKIELTETSPGSLSLIVQAGATGSEAPLTALSISGSSTTNKATMSLGGGDVRIPSPTQFSSTVNYTAASQVTFAGTTSGISHDDLDDKPPFYHGVLLDGAGGGGLIGSGSITFAVNDLLANTGSGLEGVWMCNTAVTINQDASESGALANFNAEISKFTKLAAPGDLTLADLDPSSPADTFSDTLNSFSITTTGGLTLTGSAGIILIGTVTNIGALTSTGTVSGANLTTTGTLTASGLTYPTSDGTNGQALTTDGSGNLSFTTVSGGASATTTNHYVETSLPTAYLKNGASVMDFNYSTPTKVLNLSQVTSVGSNITWGSDKFTVSADGLYTFNASGLFNTIGIERAQPTLYFYVNGSKVEGAGSSYLRNIGDSFDNSCGLNRTLELSANDYVELYAENIGRTSPGTAVRCLGLVFEAMAQEVSVTGLTVPNTLLGLTDTPSTMGTTGQVLAVNSAGTAVEFVNQSGGGGGSSARTVMLNYGFFDSNVRNVFIPLTNETETTSRQRYNVFVPTSAGEVKKFSIFVTGSKSGGTGGSIAVQKMTGATSYTTLSTATFSSLTGYSPTVLTFSNATFSAGDRIYFFFTNGFGSSIGNMMGTIEIEYS